MTWTADATGTTTTDGTEQTLATLTTNGTYCLKINLSGMLNGDEVIVQEKKKVLTGDSVAVANLWRFRDGQDLSAAIFTTEPCETEYGVTYTLQRTAGTDRSYKWEALRI